MGGHFDRVRSLRDHRARSAESRRGYYWFLTFENAPGVAALAAHCLRSIEFPYYDPAAPGGLHLTLDRIAYEGDLDPARIEAIAAAARETCRDINPFRLVIEEVGGSQGAISLDVRPDPRVHELRAAVRAATLAVHPDAPVREGALRPHISIAYANTEGVRADAAVAAVRGLNATLEPVDAPVEAVSLVLLERVPGRYRWQTLSRIAL
ncbi:2'-5' RNA ligase family protein [Nocardia sp. NPDC003693]